jgi:magnesium-protoporphyrin IX monomethyl ester (oxidative) cyclase
MSGPVPVVLVATPFLSVARPALGISALKAALAERGIGSTLLYLNVEFAARMGVDAAEHVAERTPTHLLAGEWVFSPASGPEDLLLSPGDPFYARVRAAREHAAAFVEESAARIAALQPRVAGFSTTFQQNRASLWIAERLRALAPDVCICFGGANCEGPMGRALLASYPFIDHVFSGEADRTFPGFVERLLAGERPYSSDSSVYSRHDAEGGGEVLPVLDLDALPIPDFSDYFHALSAAPYRERVHPAVLFETSRGCWWGAKHHCRFCGLNGGSLSYRSKSPGRVLFEVQAHVERWGVRRFDAADNILHLKYVDDVFGSLAADGAACSFFYEIKSNMTPAQLRRLAEGGVTWVQPGIESLDDAVLALMDKGVTGLQNVRLLRAAREVGIGVIWNLLWGFPGETPEQYAAMAELLPLLEHLDPPNGASRIRLDRFSPYFERAEEFGFGDPRPMDAYRRLYRLPDEVLRQMAYFFEGEADTGVQAQIDLLRERIAAWRARHLSARAVLEARRAGEGLLVLDTRACARSAWHLLAGVEAAVLDAFADPQGVERTLERLAASHPDENVPAAYAALMERGFVLEVAGRAVTLVVEADRRVHDEARLADFPWGWVEPEPSAEALSAP